MQVLHVSPYCSRFSLLTKFPRRSSFAVGDFVAPIPKYFVADNSVAGCGGNESFSTSAAMVDMRETPLITTFGGPLLPKCDSADEWAFSSHDAYPLTGLYMMLPFRDVEQVRGELQVGDLIEFRREDYNHWGIYIGDDLVVHVTDDSGMSSVSSSIGSFSSFSSGGLFGTDVYVRCDGLDQISGECKIRINNKDGTTRMKARPPEDIVRECKELIGKPFEYELLKNNCEHFVTRIKFGKGWSDQVTPKTENERARQRLAVVTVVGGLAVVPALALGPGVAAVYAAGALTAYSMRRMIPQ